jgi:hypothetical protein
MSRAKPGGAAAVDGTFRRDWVEQTARPSPTPVPGESAVIIVITMSA